MFILAVGSIALTGCKKDGCTDATATNYDSEAKKDDGSCLYASTTDTSGNTTPGGNGGGTTPAVTTVAQDQENIKSSMSGMVACMQTWKSGNFLSSMDDFFDLVDGEAMDEAYMESMLDGLDAVADFDYLETTNRFILSNHYGTYTFNNVSKAWTKTTGGNNATFIFPATSSSTSSVLKLVIGNYSDKKYTLEGEDLYIPTSGSVQLYKDGTEIAHFKLNKGTYEQISDMILPTEIDGSIMVAPFTYALQYVRSTPTEFSYNLDITSSASCGYNSNGKLRLTHSDYANIDGENDIDNLEINFEYPGALSLQATVDVNGISALGDDPSISQINSKFDAKVNYNAVSIGELEFVDAGLDDIQMHIRYKDNTTEDVMEAYLETFFTDMENVFSDMTGSWESEEESTQQ